MKQPSVQEQIAAILGGPEAMLEFVTQYYSGNHEHAMSSWTVTRAQVIDHAIANGIPGTWVRTQPATYDGQYLLKDADSWILKEQERGVEYGRQVFSDFGSAMEALVEYHYLPAELKAKRDEIPASCTKNTLKPVAT